MVGNRHTILINAVRLHEGRSRTAGGNFHHVLHLSEKLVASPEYNIRILTDNESFPEFATYIHPAHLIRCRLDNSSVIAANRLVVDAVRELQPSIYHRPTGQLPFRRLPCKTIAGVADLNFRHLKMPMAKRLYKELSYRWTFRQADRIVCVSHYTRLDLVKQFEVDEAKLRVVPHGTNMLPAPDCGVANAVGEPFAVTFAHQAHKNVELCVHAIARLPESRRIGLVVIGENEYVRDVLRPLVARCELTSRVHFVGRPTPPQLAGLYARAVALLFASKFEGFGLPVLEAMHAGCPVVSSNVCSLPEVVGDAAILVSPTDVQALADAIARIRDDDGFRSELCRRGILRAARFSWDAAAAKTLGIYRELTSLRPSVSASTR